MEKLTFSVLDWSILALYFLGTFLIGFFARKQSLSAQGFTTASGKIGGLLVGLSIFATYLSSISYLALPGKAFDDNWNSFVFSFSLPLAAWIAVTWFLPYYRKKKAVSAYALLEERFGLWARIYGSFFYLLTQIARIGAVTYLMALPLNVLTGVDISHIIAFLGFITVIYSLMGGIVAVIWTDAFQAFVLILGAALCIGVILFKMPGSMSDAFQIINFQNKFSLGDFSFAWDKSTFWIVLIYGLFTNLQNFGIDQSYVQRYITAKSEKEARKSIWIGALLYIPVSAMLFLIGTLLYVWYQMHPQELGQLLLTQTKGDKVFPYFIGSHLPQGITGLVIAAILSAGMSTVSTSLNSSATLLLQDYYLRFINPTASERKKMGVLYLSTVIWGIAGSLVAIYMINIKSALDVWWMLSSILSGGIAGLFLLGLMHKKATSRHALVAVVIGLALVAWMSLSVSPFWPEALNEFKSPFHSYLIIIFGTSAIIIVGLILSYFSLNTRAQQTEP